MSLTTAIVAVVSLDVIILSLLGYVLRSPFRLAAAPPAREQAPAAPRPAGRRLVRRAALGASSPARPTAARSAAD